MRSKLIFTSIFLSSLILFLSFVSVDTYNILPIKSTFNNLTAEAQKQVTCLAENIYFEAGHEPIDGQKAVAFVTLNRVQSGYAENICDVVQQKTKSHLPIFLVLRHHIYQKTLDNQTDLIV